METQTKLTNFVNNAENIVNNVIINNESVIISSKDGNAVLLSEERYNQLLMYEEFVKYGNE